MDALADDEDRSFAMALLMSLGDDTLTIAERRKSINELEATGLLNLVADMYLPTDADDPDEWIAEAEALLDRLDAAASSHTQQAVAAYWRCIRHERFGSFAFEAARILTPTSRPT